jgi:hypothetical protein
MNMRSSKDSGYAKLFWARRGAQVTQLVVMCHCMRGDTS